WVSSRSVPSPAGPPVPEVAVLVGAVLNRDLTRISGKNTSVSTRFHIALGQFSGLSRPLIEQNPNSAFFIFVLTRDVQLTRAIIDLVDNCVDGANRLRAVGRFDGLWVRIELDDQGFKISDNCGGMPSPKGKPFSAMCSRLMA